jgi:hypothetical protein
MTVQSVRFKERQAVHHGLLGLTHGGCRKAFPKALHRPLGCR